MPSEPCPVGPDSTGIALDAAMTYTYRAFISYSHAADARVAAAVQSGLHRLAQPFFSRRVINVFRDETGLAANPALWPSIEQKLGDSEYLLLFACEESAQREWVQREVEWWLAHRDPAYILIVLTGGEVTWSAAAKDFDWERTTALPRCFAGRFADIPLYVDLRWARMDNPGLTLRHTRFRAAVLDLAATLRGIPKEDLDGDDVRRQRQRRAFFGAAMMTICVLSVVAIWKAHEATLQRNEAQRRQYISVAQALAAHAVNERNGGDHELAALLARQAYLLNEHHRGERLAEVDAALRHVLASPGFHVRLSGAEEAGPTAFSPDGRWLAVAGPDQIRLWNLADPAADVAALPHRSGPIGAIAFAASATKLLAISSTGQLLRWTLTGDTPAGSQTPLPGAQRLELTSFAFDVHAAKLAAGTTDGKVLVWNVEPAPGDPLVICCTPARALVGAVALAPAPSGLVALGDDSGQVSVWDPSRPDAALHSAQMDQRVRSLAFTPDGKALAVGTDRGLPMGLLRGGVPTDDSAVEMVGGSVWIWNASTEGQPRRVGALGAGVSALAFSPDGTQLVAGAHGEPTIRRWVIAGAMPAMQPSLRHGPGRRTVAFSANGRFLATSDSGDRRSIRPSVRLWHAQASPGAAKEIHRHNGPLRGLSVDSAGKLLVSAAVGDEGLVLWDLPATRRLALLGPPQGGAVAVAVDPSGSKVAAASPMSRLDTSGAAIRIWDIRSPHAEPVVLPGHASEVRALGFDGAGTLLASGGIADPDIRLWKPDGQSATPASLPARDRGVLALAMHPRRAVLAWAGTSGALHQADMQSGRVWPMTASAGPQAAVQAVVFAASGDVLATGSDDGAVRLWPASHADQAPTVLKGHEGPVLALATDDGAGQLASASHDGTVRLWNTTHPDWAPVTITVGDAVYAVALDPAAGFLVSGDSAGRVLLWPGAARLAQRVCEVVRRDLSDAEWARFAGPGIERAPACVAVSSASGATASVRR